MSYTLRPATPNDLPHITRLVRALAAYERLAHEAIASEADFNKALFGQPPRAHCLIAEAAGQPIGFALYFYNFSTFLGRPGLYVEDIFVEPAHRGAGIGRAFFRALARQAHEQGCGRMEWAVLNWNEPAINFYRKLGAAGLSDWTTQRLNADGIAQLAAESEHG